MKICSKMAHTLCAFVRDKMLLNEVRANEREVRTKMYLYWEKWIWFLWCFLLSTSLISLTSGQFVDWFITVNITFWCTLPSTRWLKWNTNKRQWLAFSLSSSVRGWHGMKILVDCQFTTASATERVMQWLLQAKINFWSFINYYPAFYSSRSIMSSY